MTARITGIIDAQTPFHFRAIILQHHVGVLGEAFQNRDAFWSFEIEGEAALVAMQILEVRAIALAAAEGIDVVLPRAARS